MITETETDFATLAALDAESRDIDFADLPTRAQVENGQPFHAGMKTMPKDAPAARFTITDERSADWFLGKLASIEAERARRIQQLDKIATSNPFDNSIADEVLDTLTQAFTSTPPASCMSNSPLKYEEANYTMARALFPDIIPDGNNDEADRLNGYADNAFMVARVALMAEMGIAKSSNLLANSASYLMQCAAVVAERLLREGEIANQATEGGHTNG